jgi:hypothetical protein
MSTGMSTGMTTGSPPEDPARHCVLTRPYRRKVD